MSKEYSLILGQQDRSEDLEEEMLQFVVDNLLSSPKSKSMTEEKFAGYTVEEIVNSMFGNTSDEMTLEVSNGTYTVSLPVGDWKSYLSMVSSLFTHGRNVHVSYDRKRQVDEAVEIPQL